MVVSVVLGQKIQRVPERFTACSVLFTASVFFNPTDNLMFLLSSGICGRLDKPEKRLCAAGYMGGVEGGGGEGDALPGFQATAQKPEKEAILHGYC